MSAPGAWRYVQDLRNLARRSRQCALEILDARALQTSAISFFARGVPVQVGSPSEIERQGQVEDWIRVPGRERDDEARRDTHVVVEHQSDADANAPGRLSVAIAVRNDRA